MGTVTRKYSSATFLMTRALQKAMYFLEYCDEETSMRLLMVGNDC